MEYTKNYKLPQWVATDRIMMEDFNQMCADIEAGLSSIHNTAETANATAGEGAKRIGSLETRVTAVEEDVKFVKLAGPITSTTTGQAVTINLSGINMSDFVALVIYVQGKSSTGEYISINGSNVMYVLSGGESTGIGWLQPYGSRVYGRGLCHNSEASIPSSSSGSVACAWNNLTSLKIGSAGMYAGATFNLYGIKA